MDALTDPSAMMLWRGGFPLPHPGEMAKRLAELRDLAAAGPCAKSKRAAMFVADSAFAMATNAPVGGQCTADAACRAACAQLCNHAEERAVLAGLRQPRDPDRELAKMHVLHLAVDADGAPRSKPTPSCITCSRLMFEAGVEAVWLFGVHDGETAMRWKAWTMLDFHIATLRNCGLPVSPTLGLRARLHIVDRGYYGTFGQRYFAKIEGVTIVSGRSNDPKDLLDRAVARLIAAGITAETPTWEIAEQIQKSESARIAAWKRENETP